ncbi:hypothetical protein, partial [Providencia sp. CRPN80674]
GGLGFSMEMIPNGYLSRIAKIFWLALMQLVQMLLVAWIRLIAWHFLSYQHEHLCLLTVALKTQFLFSATHFLILSCHYHG